MSLPQIPLEAKNEKSNKNLIMDVKPVNYYTQSQLGRTRLSARTFWVLDLLH